MSHQRPDAGQYVGGELKNIPAMRIVRGLWEKPPTVEAIVPPNGSSDIQPSHVRIVIMPDAAQRTAHMALLFAHFELLARQTDLIVYY